MWKSKNWAKKILRKIFLVLRSVWVIEEKFLMIFFNFCFKRESKLGFGASLLKASDQHQIPTQPSMATFSIGEARERSDHGFWRNAAGGGVFEVSGERSRRRSVLCSFKFKNLFKLDACENAFSNLWLLRDTAPSYLLSTLHVSTCLPKTKPLCSRVSKKRSTELLSKI